MKNRQKKKNQVKTNPKTQNDIFKKYAAPRSINFLFYDKLQNDFHLMEKNNDGTKEDSQSNA